MNFESNEFGSGGSQTPVNVEVPSTNDDTGFLIVQLKEGTFGDNHQNLNTATLETGQSDLHAILDAFNLTGERLIKAVPPDQLHGISPGLKNYWRIDARHVPNQLDQIEQALKQLPRVKLVYREKVVTDPVNPEDEQFFNLQGYLGEAGVNVRPVWNLLDGSTGLHFIDVEQGWVRDHEDLPVTTLVHNDNRDGHGGFVGNHGCAVVGIVAGVDNTSGIIGIEPHPNSVRLVSHWNLAAGTSNIPDAVVAAMTKQPRPDVLLIEAQIGRRKLPVEVESATFTAIRDAVNSGIIVVEPAGNGNQALNEILTGEDSGAIIVGAGTAEPPHNRSIWGTQGSNFGARVNCYAWGNGITAAGYGGLQTLGAPRNYTSNFGGTSGASAIIAGCVMLLQRVRIARTGIALSPAEMRALLSNAATGTAQGGAVLGNIGVMPNLQAIVESRPDLFAGISPDVELSGTLGVPPILNR